MQKTTHSKTTATPQRALSRQQQPKSLTAPKPLDLKTLESVSGGSTLLPKKFW